jgi:penicillin-binding protein 1A
MASKKPIPARPSDPPNPRDKAPARDDAAPRRLRPRLWGVVRWSAVAAIWALVIAACLIAWVATTLPDIRDLGHSDRHPSITLRAADGSLIATYGDLYGETLRLADLPKALTGASTTISASICWASRGPPSPICAPATLSKAARP